MGLASRSRSFAEIAEIIEASAGDTLRDILGKALLGTEPEAREEPTLTDEEWDLALAEGDGDLLKKICFRQATPPDVLARLAENPDKIVRMAAVGNPALPTDVALRMLKDRNWEVRWGAADRAPDDLVASLAKDRAKLVRATVARRRVPPETLTALAADPDPEVRAAAARNPGVPGPSLAVLAADPDPEVRAGAASNPNVSGPSLAALAADPRRDVARNARTNPRFADPAVAAHAGLLAD